MFEGQARQHGPRRQYRVPAGPHRRKSVGVGRLHLDRQQCVAAPRRAPALPGNPEPHRLYRISGGTSQLRISKIVNGAETILKWVQVPMATLNAPFHLVGSVVGSTLTLTLTGGAPISVNDTTYTTGSIGVLVNTGPAGTHSADTFCASSAPRRAPDCRRPDRGISRQRGRCGDDASRTGDAACARRGLPPAAAASPRPASGARCRCPIGSDGVDRDAI